MRRNCEVDLLRGFQIDHQIEYGWLLDGQLGWLRAFQDFVHEKCGSPRKITRINAIRHEPASLDVLFLRKHRRQSGFYRQFGYCLSMSIG